MANDKTPKLRRRHALKIAATATGAYALSPFINLGKYQLFAADDTRYSSRCIELIGDSLVIDMLGVVTVNDDFQLKWLTNPESFGVDDIARMRNSGINIFHNASGIGGPDAHYNSLKYVADWNAFIANHDGVFMRIDSVTDLERVKVSGQMGIMIGIQNAEHFRSEDDVNMFHGLGQRISQLTYNARNRIGNGATERVDGGISDFGASIIKRMNEVGMGIDVSHCGEHTTLDAYELSKQPVLITHSNCRALVPNQPRAKSDAAIRAMAKAGSVMGITNVRNFVRDREPTTVEHVIDHYDHVIKLAGMDHVCVGTDSDLAGYDALPQEEQDRLRVYFKESYAFRHKIDIEGLEHPKKMFDLVEGFIRRGYSDANIRDILGGNAKRVLAEVWG